MTLSVVLITQNEEQNLPRTLESVMPLVRDGKGEIIVVDSGSTDRTVEIAQSYRREGFCRDVERLCRAEEFGNGQGVRWIGCCSWMPTRRWNRGYAAEIEAALKAEYGGEWLLDSAQELFSWAAGSGMVASIRIPSCG